MRAYRSPQARGTPEDKMEELTKRKCEACHAGASRISDEDISKYKPNIPEWEISEVNQIKRLVRAFKFKNFREAISFTDKVGSIAEEEGHHPLIQTEWGKVTVSWWTHAIRGLHINDFIMASKTDALYES
jgi:4a-hydroxytetrahydrobiopterin dehydratase